MRTVKEPGGRGVGVEGRRIGWLERVLEDIPFLRAGEVR
jgi:hypothetical protein